MSSYPPLPPPPTFALLSRAFAYRRDARFTGLLEPSFFQSLADKHDVHFGSGRNDTFNPPVTTWAWLSQVLSPCKCCDAAVCRVMALCCSLDRPLCSAANGGYCKAREKLPETFVRDLCVQLGQAVEARALDGWKWQGRCVKYVDGSVLQLPDTAENLKEYPQQRSQKKGTGYTSMRVVVMLAFATGVLIDAASGPYKGKGSGETSLLQQILGSVKAGDILGGDRLHGSYLLLASLLERGGDGCFRLNASRKADLSQGECLGEDDYLQTWSKPRRPKCVDKDTWDRLPEQIKVRVLRIVVARQGWRTKEIYIVTTLCDAKKYSKEEIGALYKGRWNAELDIRALKQGLGMKMLNCKTPEMVRTEWWMHLLGYNLVRTVMAQAAQDKGLKPREVSFSGAVQTLDAFRWMLSCGSKDSDEMGEVLSTALASHRVGNRPGRYEPREIKHRQRKYKELKKSRQQRREELAASANDPQEKGRGKKGRVKGGGRDRPSGR